MPASSSHCWRFPSRIFRGDVDPMSLDRYLTYGYVPHPRTILEGVYKLPPAHFAVWHEGQFRLERYWEPPWEQETQSTLAENEERLRVLLDEAVREQMVSDVPLGAFLSGGVDSTIIAGLMQRASSRPIKTFSIGFDDPAFDESRFAEHGSATVRDGTSQLRGQAKGLGDLAPSG